MDANSHDLCHNATHIDPPRSPVFSAIMFATGFFGNLAALVILTMRRRKDAKAGGTSRGALFHIVITALVVTDLTGTCLLSPLVQLAYSRNTTLVGMWPQNVACQYFGVTMTFLTLANLLLLLMMALERCVAIGYPYLYSRVVTRKCAYITIPVLFVLCILFCLLPFAGFGKYVQYCPGTWCFIDMNPEQVEDRAYADIYATVMLLLVLATVACNCFVVYHLFKMYQRRRRNGSVTTTTRSNNERRAMSLAEEVEYLILLVFMTIIFFICTMPLVIRVYINSVQLNEKTTKESHYLDLIVLLIISFNPIIDPWVFILLSPSVLHFCRAALCHSPLGASRSYMFKSSIAKEHTRTNVELCRQTLDYNEEVHSGEKV